MNHSVFILYMSINGTTNKNCYWLRTGYVAHSMADTVMDYVLLWSRLVRYHTLTDITYLTWQRTAAIRKEPLTYTNYKSLFKFSNFLISRFSKLNNTKFRTMKFHIEVLMHKTSKFQNLKLFFRAFKISYLKFWNCFWKCF